MLGAKPVKFVDEVEVVLAHRHVGDHCAEMLAQFGNGLFDP